jgi:polar amino acid transport system substrate-binding protein
MIGNWNFKPGLVLLVMIGLVIAFMACVTTTTKTTTPPPQPQSDNVLRVGVSTNAPPIIFKQGGRITGLEADFAREFATYLGKSLHFVELKWDKQVTALLNNQTDIIMSGMTKTTLREARVSFSTPYFRSGQMALIRMKDAASFRTGFYSIRDELAIGAVEDTTGEFFVLEQFGDNKTVTFSKSTDGVEALIKGEIDIFIHDAPVIMYLGSENENRRVTPVYSLFTEEYLAWAMRKDDTRLLDAANGFLQEINDNGRLKQMIQRWIPLTK